VPGAYHGLGLRTRSNDLREQRIARQIEVVLAQEEALDRRRAELRDREERLARRQQEVDQQHAELTAIWARRAADLDAREAEIAAREAALDERAKELEEAARKKARSLAEETVSLAERNRNVAWREKVVGAAPPEHSPASTGEDTLEIPAAPQAPAEGWNLNRIERLVEEHADANPARADEWRYYLVYLREHAEVGGALPRSFDWLVWDAFGDLLAQAPAETPA